LLSRLVEECRPASSVDWLMLPASRPSRLRRHSLEWRCVPQPDRNENRSDSRLVEGAAAIYRLSSRASDTRPCTAVSPHACVVLRRNASGATGLRRSLKMGREHRGAVERFSARRLARAVPRSTRSGAARGSGFAAGRIQPGIQRARAGCRTANGTTPLGTAGRTPSRSS
jgi:hypothetical protein